MEKAPFHHLEELMLHSFDARVVALFLVKLREIIHLNLNTPEQVAVAVKTLRPVQLWTLVDEVRSAAFSWDIVRKANEIRPSHLPKKKGSSSAQVEQLGTSLDVNAEDAPDPVCDVDVEFLTHVRFLQAVKTYKALKYSIQRGDIGLLPGFLPVRTVPVLGLVLHVLLGLEPRTAPPGTRAGGTSTVPVLAVLCLKWRISLILINLRFIFFESHLLLVNSYQY